MVSLVEQSRRRARARRAARVPARTVPARAVLVLEAAVEPVLAAGKAELVLEAKLGVQRPREDREWAEVQAAAAGARCPI